MHAHRAPDISDQALTLPLFTPRDWTFSDHCNRCIHPPMLLT